MGRAAFPAAEMRPSVGSMKIYTRTGDQGETGLFGGARVKKNDIRVEAYGTVDELNAAIGLARAAELPTELAESLLEFQKHLFTLGAELACQPGKQDKLKMTLVGAFEIKSLEDLIDQHEAALPPLTTFILPAGSKAGAALHFARTVARRAERACLHLEDLRSEALIYLNRLSDTLFVLARRANQLDGVEETPWIGRGS